MLNDCKFYHLVLPNYKLSNVFSNSNPNTEPKSQGIYDQTPRLRTPVYYGKFS